MQMELCLKNGIFLPSPSHHNLLGFLKNRSWEVSGHMRTSQGAVGEGSPVVQRELADIFKNMTQACVIRRQVRSGLCF